MLVAILYKDLARHAALADVSINTMKLVLNGEPITTRARARARTYLERSRLLGLIRVPVDTLLARLDEARPKDPA